MRINSTLYYVLKDHLGSSSVVTDAEPLLPPPNPTMKILNPYPDFSLSYLGEVPSQVPTESYRRGLATHKHAVASLSTGETYTYDANGNMTQRVEGGLTYAQTFDAENRLISVTVSGQTTQFIYDGDGILVKKVKPDHSKTIYPSTAPQGAAAPLRAGVGGIYEVDKASGGIVPRTNPKTAENKQVRLRTPIMQY